MAPLGLLLFQMSNAPCLEASRPLIFKATCTFSMGLEGKFNSYTSLFNLTAWLKQHDCFFVLFFTASFQREDSHWKESTSVGGDGLGKGQVPKRSLRCSCWSRGCRKAPIVGKAGSFLGFN